MDYEISLSEDKSIVLIRVKKHLTTQMALTFTKEAVGLAEKYKINRYLIDIRGIRNTWSVFETYQFAQDINKYGRQRLDKVALVIDPEDKTHTFLETALVNQNYNNYLFKDYDKAIAWLKEE
ncbi:MAG: hypothetical protein PHW62_01190 [Candidatus Ratteibacteria bacterium]|nr:hypothetical protein [Candidatus Ratteibacteria bacterium]